MGKIVLRLDRMMVERKMSLNELSEHVGISNVNLSKIKTGKLPQFVSVHFRQSARHLTASREIFWNIRQRIERNKVKVE